MQNSNKKSYSDFKNKEEFPFEFKENNTIITFPKLYSKINNSDKKRFWYIYSYISNKVNGDKIKLNNSLLSLDNFNSNKYNKLKLYIITEYGQINGKTTITEPTIIEKGKNLGKINETSILTQGLIFMRNLYLKKIKNGYNTELTKNKINNKIYPMAVHIYEKNKKKIKYPCYVQEKLNGLRMISRILNNKIVLLSRRLNEYYGFDHIKEELSILLNNDNNIILDGELYNPKLSLQEISGIGRDENINNPNKLNVKYYIFDYIDLSKKLTFDERYNNLKLNFTNKKFKYLILTEAKLINSEKESDKLYNEHLALGHEGIIYKNKDSLYEYSSIKEIRSYNYLKRKAHMTSEYKIVDFTSGSIGKDKDCIIFIMETEEGKLFNVTPNMTLNERKKLYKDALINFDKNFKNKMGEVAYDELSKDKIPLRAKFIRIREELD